MESNELILKLDKETTIPLIEGLGKSAYAIAVAHGFRGTEQEWLDSLKGPQGEPGTKGEAFRYEDFTPEQLAALKGPKGDAGTGSNVDLSDYTTKKDADNLYLKKVDIRAYLTMIGDPKYALKTELNNYVSKTDAETSYSKKSELNDYIKKTEINQYTSNIQLTPEQLEKLKGPKGDDGRGLDVTSLTNALKGIGLTPTGSDVYQLITDALIAVKNGADIGRLNYWEQKTFEAFFYPLNAGDTELRGTIPTGFYTSINGQNKRQWDGSGQTQDAHIEIPTGVENFTVEVYLPNEELIGSFLVSVPQAPKYTAPNPPTGMTIISEYTDRDNTKWTVYDAYDGLDDAHTQVAYCDISDIKNNALLDTLTVQNASNLKRIIMYATKPVTVYTDSGIKAPAGATLEYHNKDLITISIL